MKEASREQELELLLDAATEAIKVYMLDNEKLDAENKKLKQQIAEISAAALAVHTAVVELDGAVNL